MSGVALYGSHLGQRIFLNRGGLSFASFYSLIAMLYLYSVIASVLLSSKSKEETIAIKFGESGTENEACSKGVLWRFKKNRKSSLNPSHHLFCGASYFVPKCKEFCRATAEEGASLLADQFDTNALLAGIIRVENGLTDVEGGIEDVITAVKEKKPATAQVNSAV